MNAKQKKDLITAWELQTKILDEIGQLAHISLPLAYGVIGTGEAIVDIIMLGHFRKSEQGKVTEG